MTTNRPDRLAQLCSTHAGEHYESKTWQRAANTEDWSDHWPVVDGGGLLTGEIYESGDPNNDGYANVDDEAMVSIADLSDRQRREIATDENASTWGGYAVCDNPQETDR